MVFAAVPGLPAQLTYQQGYQKGFHAAFKTSIGYKKGYDAGEQLARQRMEMQVNASRPVLPTVGPAARVSTLAASPMSYAAPVAQSQLMAQPQLAQ